MAERDDTVERLCQAALDRDPGERTAFLATACDDEAMRREVESLLALDASVSRFLETPAVQIVSSAGGGALLAGSRFGPYEVADSLGAGGMAEVYRAHDTRLRRDVALKVLPDALAVDPGRVRRFQREAQTLALLNHPNIAAIYGLEEAGGVRALVLELVEGETLAERIARGRIPLAAALAIARQILDALEVAHAKGIVHRDLKPANIKLHTDGTVKVLDFGLAKMFDSGTEGPADVSAADASTPGMLLGTAAYMAPEQARGEEVDRCADVWAFGCVLYEMLTAKAAFAGATNADVLAAILKSEPDWTMLPAETPAAVRRLLRRCMARDRHLRLHDMGDARLDVVEAGEDPPSESTRRAVPRVAWTALAVVAALAIVAVVWRGRGPEPIAAAAELRVEINTPPTYDPLSFEISPDGRQLAFVASFEGRSQLWIRRLDELTTRVLPGTENAAYPFWSPDSRSIGFFANRKLKRVNVADGAIRILASTRLGLGGTWGTDHEILFASATRAPIRRVADTGGAVAMVTQVGAAQMGHRFPRWLPDGRHFLYYAWSGSDGGAVFVARADGSAARKLLDADSIATYVKGHLLFVREGTLYAMAFDPVAIAVSGTPFPVAQRVANLMVFGSAAVSASPTGVIVYREASTAGRRQFVWFDRQGNELSTLDAPKEDQGPASPSLSPDGRHITLSGGPSGNPDIWIMDAVDGRLSRFTLKDSSDSSSVWSPDGKRIAFASDFPDGHGPRIYVMSNTTGAEYELLSPMDPSIAVVPEDWSPDGKYILYNAANDQQGSSDVMALPLFGSRTPIVVANTKFEERAAQFSPDGKWVAFHSDESGRFEVYVQPFPAAGERKTVSTAGGTLPRWSRAGTELFYVAADSTLMSVPVRKVAGALQFDAPTKLFATRMVSGLPGQGDARQQYVVSPDAQRFLIRSVTRADTSPLVVVANWKPSPGED